MKEIFEPNDEHHTNNTLVSNKKEPPHKKSEYAPLLLVHIFEKQYHVNIRIATPPKKYKTTENDIESKRGRLADECRLRLGHSEHCE